MYKDILCPCCGLRLKEAAESCSRCGLTGLNQIFLDKESYQRWKMEVLIPHKRSWEAKLAEERRREEERRRAAQRENARRQAKSRSRLIPGAYGNLLILMENSDLYGMGANRSGQFGDVGMTWVDDPMLLAKHVRSAALNWNYTIYITEYGFVNLLGNGEYVDRFPGIKNAQKVLTRRGAFFIRTSNGRWIAFGDNGDEEIAKRTKRTIFRFQDIPYSLNYSIPGGSRGPITDGERKDVRNSAAESSVKSTDEYRKLCEKYGGANVKIENLQLRPTRRSGEGYSYSEEGGCSAEAILENRHIYAPIETKPRLENMDDICRGYCGGNFAIDPGFWWEKEGGKVFLALQDEEHGFEVKKHRLITTGVREMYTISAYGSYYEVVLSMKDGRILYGDVDAFSKTWNLSSLKVFKP